MFVDDIFAFKDADLVFAGVIIAVYIVIVYVQRTFNKKI